MAQKQRIKGNNNILNNGVILINTEKSQLPKIEVKVQHDESKHISNTQAKEIQDLIHEIGRLKSIGNNDNKKLYAVEWKLFKDKFKLIKYELLPIEQFDEAIKWLKRRCAQATNNLRNGNEENEEEYKIKRCKAIYSKGKLNFKMETKEILVFAQQYLNIEVPLTSLKQLSIEQIDVLYNKLFGRG